MQDYLDLKVWEVQDYVIRSVKQITYRNLWGQRGCKNDFLIKSRVAARLYKGLPGQRAERLLPVEQGHTNTEVWSDLCQLFWIICCGTECSELLQLLSISILLLFKIFSAESTEEYSEYDKNLAEQLAEKYSDSAYYRETKAQLESISSGNKKKNRGLFRQITYANSFLHQLKWVSRRTFKNLIGNPQASIAQVRLFVPIILWYTLNLFGSWIIREVTGMVLPLDILTAVSLWRKSAQGQGIWGWKMSSMLPNVGLISN